MESLLVDVASLAAGKESLFGQATQGQIMKTMSYVMGGMYLAASIKAALSVHVLHQFQEECRCPHSHQRFMLC